MACTHTHTHQGARTSPDALTHTLTLSSQPNRSGVTLSEGGQQVLLVFTHAVFSFLALFGLSQVTTSSPSTASQRIGATVAFFGFTALCGALLAIFKMFVPRLNVIRNRFTVHVVETETDLVAIPCDASGTPVRDLDNVQSAPSTGPSGDGSTQEENAQKRTAAGDPTYETASPFYAPAPAPAPAYYPQSAPATSSEGDAPTTDV